MPSTLRRRPLSRLLAGRRPRLIRLAAYRLVSDELILDGNSRQNLATFCQTWLEPEVRDLMRETLDKNMVDKDEYPQTAAIEARCVHILADLWNSPEAENILGTSTTGSSEAAMLGGMALLWKWRERRRAAGLSTDKPNLICGPVQVCWHKFARYWDIGLRDLAEYYFVPLKACIDKADVGAFMCTSPAGLCVVLSGPMRFCSLPCSLARLPCPLLARLLSSPICHRLIQCHQWHRFVRQ